MIFIYKSSKEKYFVRYFKRLNTHVTCAVKKHTCQKTELRHTNCRESKKKSRLLVCTNQEENFYI